MNSTFSNFLFKESFNSIKKLEFLLNEDSTPQIVADWLAEREYDPEVVHLLRNLARKEAIKQYAISAAKDVKRVDVVFHRIMGREVQWFLPKENFPNTQEIDLLYWSGYWQVVLKDKSSGWHLLFEILESDLWEEAGKFDKEQLLKTAILLWGNRTGF